MIIPTTDPLHFSRDASLITFPAPVSHPHMALQHGEEIFVPDLASIHAFKLVCMAACFWRACRHGTAGKWKRPPAGAWQAYGRRLFTRHGSATTTSVSTAMYHVYSPAELNKLSILH